MPSSSGSDDGRRSSGRRSLGRRSSGRRSGDSAGWGSETGGRRAGSSAGSTHSSGLRRASRRSSERRRPGVAPGPDATNDTVVDLDTVGSLPFGSGHEARGEPAGEPAGEPGGEPGGGVSGAPRGGPSAGRQLLSPPGVTRGSLAGPLAPAPENRGPLRRPANDVSAYKSGFSGAPPGAPWAPWAPAAAAPGAAPRALAGAPAAAAPWPARSQFRAAPSPPLPAAAAGGGAGFPRYPAPLPAPEDAGRRLLPAAPGAVFAPRTSPLRPRHGTAPGTVFPYVLRAPRDGLLPPAVRGGAASGGAAVGGAAAPGAAAPGAAAPGAAAGFYDGWAAAGDGGSPVHPAAGFERVYFEGPHPAAAAVTFRDGSVAAPPAAADRVVVHVPVFRSSRRVLIQHRHSGCCGCLNVGNVCDADSGACGILNICGCLDREIITKHYPDGRVKTKRMPLRCCVC